jgi:hypothetical protein
VRIATFARQCSICLPALGTAEQLSAHVWRNYDGCAWDEYVVAEPDDYFTAVMCSPWTGGDAMLSGDHGSFKFAADRYREPDERFADTVIAKLR